jgi:hypothetical protein
VVLDGAYEVSRPTTTPMHICLSCPPCFKLEIAEPDLSLIPPWPCVHRRTQGCSIAVNGVCLTVTDFTGWYALLLASPLPSINNHLCLPELTSPGISRPCAPYARQVTRSRWGVPLRRSAGPTSGISRPATRSTSRGGSYHHAVCVSLELPVSLHHSVSCCDEDDPCMAAAAGPPVEPSRCFILCLVPTPPPQEPAC